MNARTSFLLLNVLACVSPAALQVAVGAESWRNDHPGVVHQVLRAELPPPFATPSANRQAQVVARPANAVLAVPPKFRVDLFAPGLKTPRVLRVAPNGDIFFSELGGSRVSVIRPSADFTKPASKQVFAQGLDHPYGLQFYPVSGDPRWLYVAEHNRVVRYAYINGDLQARGALQVVVPQLSPNADTGHSSRDLLFSADGRRMFVAVGSGSNVAEQMPSKTVAQAQAWEAQKGLGAAWGTEENRADVLVFDAANPGAPKAYATGIRNCAGLALQQATGDIWCTVNERDELGNELVPDYSTRVKEGAFYGWPWYYSGNHEEPRLSGDRPDLAGKATKPDVLYAAHSASLHMLFYQANTGKSAFPAQYFGSAFVAFHGSWNRSTRTGHKVVRLKMNNDLPSNSYEDFLTGFIINDDQVWGRPVALAQLADGSLLLSDDGGNAIYRISYTR